MRENFIREKVGKLQGKLPTLNGGNMKHFHNRITSRRDLSWTDHDVGDLSPVSLLPSIPSIAIIILASFSLAEIMSFAGLFQDQHGIQAKAKADVFRENYLSGSDDDNFEDRFEQIGDAIGNWWQKNRKRNGLLRLSTWKRKVRFMIDLYGIQGFFGTLQYLSFKHQFAIGCSVGMIFQRVALSVGQAAFFVYVASEMMYNLKKASAEMQNDDDFHNIKDARGFDSFRRHDFDKNVCGDAIEVCSDCLEKVRFTVRSSFDAIIAVLNEDNSPLDDSVGTAIVAVIFGVILKSII